jgi:hypothetical protein
MSPSTNIALSETPAWAAFFFESATMFGLNSTPRARAPRLAAPITFRPSPDPRSMTKSCGVTAARSSIRSTSSGGVGTQTTSLPGWPGWGTNPSSWARAEAGTAMTRAMIKVRKRNEGFIMRGIIPMCRLGCR